MAKARVELVRAESHEARGRVFKKRQPRVLTDDGDIAYYKLQPEFSVTMLKEAVKKPKVPEPEPEAPEAPETPEEHTEESLGKLTKTQLINLAASEPFNLALDNEMRKADMIEAVLEAAEADDDD